MRNEIVKTPVLNSDWEVIAPTGTVLTPAVFYSLALKGVDTIETYTGTLHLSDIRANNQLVVSRI